MKHAENKSSGDPAPFVPAAEPMRALRSKNRLLLGLLVALIALLYALSFVKFGMAVYHPS